MRKIYDINEFIDIMSNIKDGCFATVCYLSSAKVKTMMKKRLVNQVSFSFI